MRELLDIVAAYDAARDKNLRTALATVVQVEGSSYRKPGARMLIREDGELTGAISGGCLEGDALYKALQVMTSGKTTLVTYDTSDDDDAKLGLGLGCNGIIQVLIEPLENKQVIEILKLIPAKRRAVSLVTLFSMSDKKDVRAGTCLLLSEDEEVSISSQVPLDQFRKDAYAVLKQNHSVFNSYTVNEKTISAFIEWIAPQISLVIAGGGNDVRPLADIATIIGWNVTIVHGKARGSSEFRFNPSCRVIISKPESALDNISVDNQTVFVLMTHNYNFDLAILKELIKRKAIYIGVLGAKKKLSRMRDELAEQGMQLSDEQLNTIYGPVGLDIGAETPEEIALSIAAEIKSVLTGKNAGQLSVTKKIPDHQQTSY